MASTHIALLRGINIGKAKRIAMADLRALLERMGFLAVRTLLNSGNAVFAVAGRAPKDLAGRIERAIADELGVRSRTTVISGAQLDAIVAGNSLLDVATDFSRMMIAVPASAAELERAAPLVGNDWGVERFALGGHAAYLWCPASILDSPLYAAFGRAMGDAVTARNWATMLKLQALAAEVGHQARDIRPARG